MTNTIVIPDVHGREFWKTVLNEKAKLIFLGDYLDPYLDEEEFDQYNNYSDFSLFKKVKNNLLEIIQLKKERPDDVTLLLGNHDLPYMKITSFSCRYTTDKNQREEYYKIFKENRGLFQLCYTKQVEDKNFLFSHAGILKEWLRMYPTLFKNVEEQNLPKYINYLFEIQDPIFLSSLDEVSFWRGGYSSAGSLIWADIRELITGEKLESYYQIVGHTYLKKEPYIGKGFCCIDTRTCYKLDELCKKLI